MRKVILATAMVLGSFMGKAQFTQSDLIYYVGEGPDTAILVIDFLDDTPDSSYAWGYLFDESETVTGGDMLEAIAADEQTLNVVTGGGFLNDIMYNAHVGLAGDPNYWGTWSRTAETAWESNMGLGTTLANGDWFGCSYTDFDPAIVPGEPIAAYASAKYQSADVSFWVGTGNDSAVFVIDFISDVYGEAVSYAWGYAFDGPVEASEMLADIDAADVNLSLDADAFLNDILFNGLEGLAGDPYYWGTWSGTNLSDWTMNAGLSTEVNDGDWFGCTYGDWPPRRPFYPISALDSAAFTFDDVEFVFGSGDNKVVLVIDYNEWAPGSSYAYGYAFSEETITASEMMTELESAGLFALSFDLTGGFLNSIENTVTGEAGIGGAPYYWGTWSANNVGGWEMNAGISEELSNGDWFACSYTAWNPATPPDLPEPGEIFSGIEELTTQGLTVYPNPATTEVQVQLEKAAKVEVVDMQGRVLIYTELAAGTSLLDITALERGIYFVLATKNGTTVKQKLVVE